MDTYTHLAVGAIIGLAIVTLIWTLLWFAGKDDRDKRRAINEAAKRLGLRDKGHVASQCNSAGKEGFLYHPLCNKRVRIGISKDGNPVRYCWFCEYIFDKHDTGPGPDDGESLPEEEIKTTAAVLEFKRQSR